MATFWNYTFKKQTVLHSVNDGIRTVIFKVGDNIWICKNPEYPAGLYLLYDIGDRRIVSTEKYLLFKWSVGEGIKKSLDFVSNVLPNIEVELNELPVIKNLKLDEPVAPKVKVFKPRESSCSSTYRTYRKSRYYGR